MENKISNHRPDHKRIEKPGEKGAQTSGQRRLPSTSESLENTKKNTSVVGGTATV